MTHAPTGRDINDADVSIALPKMPRGGAGGGQPPRNGSWAPTAAYSRLARAFSDDGGAASASI